ncbi:MAG: hypothetical protein A2283_17905 [Lentisphaerae bacterium RIFOXYA12_FULL_48_11]|nr:MAG: hypothetical protein A2283_17905 [Lentisphaerae bacterium RIFOXYA12_FULL_48_11]
MTMKRITGTIAITGVILSGILLQAAQAAEEKKSWTDNVTIKGDLRYRYETIEDDSKLNSDKETFTRDRNRIRARLGVEAKVNDNMKAGVALSTGQNDPVSGNQTIGDSFQKKDFKLDQAYFDWSLFNNDPTTIKLVGGKQKNSFMPTSSSDLIWDGDATPEGLVLKGATGNETISIGSNLGYLWLQERSSNSDDTMLYIGQGFVTFDPMPELSLKVGATYYGYQEVQGSDVLDWEGKNNSYGNSTMTGSKSGSTTNKAWASEFTPIEIFAVMDMFVMGLPVSIYGQTVKNNDASTDFDSGYLYGISFGKAKNPKTFEVGYRFAELEKDAVLGCLTDSDRWGGGTDGKGHKVYGKYQIAKNFQVGLTYFMDEKKISDASKTTDYNRMQADLIYSF